MPPFQLSKSGLALLCLSVLAVTANSQTPVSSEPAIIRSPTIVQQEQKPKPSVIAPTVGEAPRVAGKTGLYCAGYIRYQTFPHLPQIVGGEQEQEQRTFSAGTIVYLNEGSQQGIHEGQEFQIIRPKGDVKEVHRQKKDFLGTYVQEVGQLQVLKAFEHTSVAQITFSCDMVLLGDLLTQIPLRVSPLQRAEENLDRFADPSGKQTGVLMMAHDAHEMLTKHDVVFIDLGAEDKVAPGDYLTIYRDTGTGNLTTMDSEENARGRASGFQSDKRRGGGFSIQAQRAKDSTAFVNSEGRYRYKPITTKGVKRDRPLMPRKIVGEMVIIDVQTRTATAIITRAVMEIHTGDKVEVQ